MANPQADNNSNKPKATNEKKPDLETLFASYEKLNGMVDAARAEVEGSIEARSDVVKSIITHYGAGPYEFDGMIMQAVIRTATVEEGSDEVPTSTAFFKVMGKNQKLQKVGKK